MRYLDGWWALDCDGGGVAMLESQVAFSGLDLTPYVSVAAAMDFQATEE